jgi:hypothetical protein
MEFGSISFVRSSGRPSVRACVSVVVGFCGRSLGRFFVRLRSRLFERAHDVVDRDGRLRDVRRDDHLRPHATDAEQ